MSGGSDYLLTRDTIARADRPEESQQQIQKTGLHYGSGPAPTVANHRSGV